MLFRREVEKNEQNIDLNKKKTIESVVTRARLKKYECLCFGATTEHLFFFLLLSFFYQQNFEPFFFIWSLSLDSVSIIAQREAAQGNAAHS